MMGFSVCLSVFPSGFPEWLFGLAERLGFNLNIFSCQLTRMMNL
jgi:hypothetical protein